MSTATNCTGGPQLDRLAQSQTLRAGSELYHQGTMPQAIYFIQPGTVKLVRLEATGKELIINLRPPCRWLGIAPAIAELPYHLTVVTLSKCGLQRLPVSAFLRLVETDAQFAQQILQACSRNVIAFNIHLAQVASLPAR